MTPEQVKSVLIGNVKLFHELQQQLQKASPISPCKGTRRRGDDVRDDSSGSSKLELAYVQGIFAKFGVRPFADGSSKERLSLAVKLADSVFADNEAVANEARETMKREAGYWRYVNRGIYNAMVRNHEIVNWETGEKLVQDDIDEDEEQERDLEVV
jgi:hypothetical protein